MNASRLVFESITGGYGSTTIVRDLSGAAIAGDALCVLGRNGVGKSTLMKLLFGYLPCLSGRILLDGRPIEAFDPSARRRQPLRQLSHATRRKSGTERRSRACAGACARSRALRNR